MPLLRYDYDDAMVFAISAAACHADAAITLLRHEALRAAMLFATRCLRDTITV